MEEDYLPSLNESISAVVQLAVGQMDESRWVGLLGAEAEIRSNQWFRSANNSVRSTNARLKPPA